jgi:hypothetical protein
MISTSSTYPLTSCEFLTIEELAGRLQVSRATLFNWIKKGILAQGRHYFKRGHVLRFIWSGELIQELLTGSPENVEKVPPVKPSLKPVSQIKPSPINWEY